ncbi:polymeric immunoglobulin receptor-like [Notothenia coriiceps]|uniref:polymeric immunoglobulin receptor-like n=1 Tax=Notothenia coriiceps TaxID=8208 RepID=UPI000552D3BC|nr:PREDICTED: polymeric immunoglobulin receptor-like [Notothenia coriiceps]
MCKGYLWASCSYEVKTNKPSSSGKFSISDDKKQRVFTVTINDLTDKDTEYYWCAVEINEGADLKEYFHLSVTGGTPNLYVDQQEITGFKGDSINIKCHYQNSGERKWCRFGGCCVKKSGLIDGTRVEISALSPGVLTVTLRGLRTESSGWYLCVQGDLQMPVHITVTEKPTTIAATRQITTFTPTSKPLNHTSSTAEQRLSTVEVEQQSVSVNLMVFIIPLSSLIFIVTVASFICLMFKRHKQTTGDSPATIMGKEEVAYSTVKQRRKTSGQLHRAEEEVTYSDVKQRKPTDKWSDANRDVDVMYSDVIYSSVEKRKYSISSYMLLARSHSDMAVHLGFLLILTGLTGIHSITTVSQVSVRAGGSITIPCLYESKYTNHVKYLCKGYYWNSCSYAIKTNQHNSRKFSISDDKKQRVFTVTIKGLTGEDTNYYWCAVEINDGADVKEYFHLSVTGGTPSLYVAQQEITGFKGDNINIKCHYQNSGERKWCRLGGSCVTKSGLIDGTRVDISARNDGVLNVTLSGLRAESSGWYWCVKGDLQMPVHITVTEKPPTSKCYKSLNFQMQQSLC